MKINKLISILQEVEKGSGNLEVGVVNEVDGRFIIDFPIDGDVVEFENEKGEIEQILGLFNLDLNEYETSD